MVAHHPITFYSRITDKETIGDKAYKFDKTLQTLKQTDIGKHEIDSWTQDENRILSTTRGFQGRLDHIKNGQFITCLDEATIHGFKSSLPDAAGSGHSNAGDDIVLPGRNSSLGQDDPEPKSEMERRINLRSKALQRGLPKYV